MRDKDVQMRQTATGALAAGLLGGISEPSLYGIHLRFKPMILYIISITAAFLTAMILVIISDYRTPEQKAEAAAERAQAEADLALESTGRHAKGAPAAAVAAVAGVGAVSGGGGVATLVATTDIATAVAGKVHLARRRVGQGVRVTGAR